MTESPSAISQGVTQLTLRRPQEAPAETGGPDFSRGEHPDEVERSAPTEVGATRQLQGNCVTPTAISHRSLEACYLRRAWAARVAVARFPVLSCPLVFHPRPLHGRRGPGRAGRAGRTLRARARASTHSSRVPSTPIGARVGRPWAARRSR